MLKRKARKQAAEKGHKLGRFELGYSKTYHRAACTVCEAVVFVHPNPVILHEEKEISGAAVERLCKS